MLPHEIVQWESSPSAIQSGHAELWDATSVANYTFYGIAQLAAGVAAPDQTKAIWFIIVYKQNADGTPAGAFYYPPNQTWSTRTGLTLP